MVPATSSTGVCFLNLFFCSPKLRMVTSRMGMLLVTAYLEVEQQWKRDAAYACSEMQCHPFCSFVPFRAISELSYICVDGFAVG